jgi:hypothetical protein
MHTDIPLVLQGNQLIWMIRICIIGFVLVDGQNPILDALSNDAAEVDFGGCVDKWFQLSDELVAPSCTLFC